MNKARMTFRFNEERSDKLKADQDEQKTAPRQAEEKQEMEAQGPGHTDIMDSFRYDYELHEPVKKTRDHLTVISGPMPGWSDPFEKEDPWGEMLAGQQPPLKNETDSRLEDLYDLDAYGSEIVKDDYAAEGMNLADSVYPEIRDGSYRPRRPASLWKIVGTITGAVVTGALFGFVVLSFFKDGSEGSILPGSPGTESVTQAQTEAAKAAPVTVQVQGQSYYMLQYGVFSSQERAEQAQKELQQLGVAAGRDPDQENRVYAGVSTDRDLAKLLSNQMKGEGLELYVKEIKLPAATEMNFGGEADTVNQYFAVSSELVSKLSQISAELLGQENPPALDADNNAVLTDLHSRWLESIKSLQTGLGQDEEELGARMEQSMNSAVSAITEYNRNHSKGHLWEVQSSMLEYIKGQKALIEKLGKA